MKKIVEPSILYFGTPVLLLSTLNLDGTCNVAPMSSAWWLGWNCMLGLGGKGHTAQNLLRERECVLNLPSSAMTDTINRLARLTGSDPVPPHKQAMGYRHCKDKLAVAGLTAQASALVRPPRLAECPVQMEAVLEATHAFGHAPGRQPGALAFEVRIVRTYVEESLLIPGAEDRIDSDAWRPMVMSFCNLYGLGSRLEHSRLAEIPEWMYRPAAAMGR